MQLTGKEKPGLVTGDVWAIGGSYASRKEGWKKQNDKPRPKRLSEMTPERPRPSSKALFTGG